MLELNKRDKIQQLGLKDHRIAIAAVVPAYYVEEDRYDHYVGRIFDFPDRNKGAYSYFENPAPRLMPASPLYDRDIPAVVNLEGFLDPTPILLTAGVRLFWEQYTNDKPNEWKYISHFPSAHLIIHLIALFFPHFPIIHGGNRPTTEGDIQNWLTPEEYLDTLDKAPQLVLSMLTSLAQKLENNNIEK